MDHMLDRDSSPQDGEEEHEAYRSWCLACVAGSGRRGPQKKAGLEAAKAVPVVSLDYCYMGHAEESELTSKCMPILVVKSHADRWMQSHAIPRKGCRHPWGNTETFRSSRADSKSWFSIQMENSGAEKRSGQKSYRVS
eukprot:1775759-Amphidinium_carterae.1